MVMSKGESEQEKLAREAADEIEFLRNAAKAMHQQGRLTCEQFREFARLDHANMPALFALCQRGPAAPADEVKAGFDRIFGPIREFARRHGMTKEQLTAKVKENPDNRELLEQAERVDTQMKKVQARFAKLTPEQQHRFAYLMCEVRCLDAKVQTTAVIDAEEFKEDQRRTYAKFEKFFAQLAEAEGKAVPGGK